MRGCYRDAANRPPPPARISLDNLTEEHVELYAHVLPPEKPIPIKVALLPVDDTISGEEGVAKAATWIQLHLIGGPSGMKAEHLRMWI